MPAGAPSDDWRLWEKRASALERSGDPEGAIASYRRLLELNPDNGPACVIALRNLAAVLFNLGRFAESGEAFERLSELEPEVDAHLAHARDAFINARDRGRALALARRLMDREPDDVDNLLRTGDLLCARGELNEALLCYERAVMLRPDDASAWVRRGDAECLAGRAQEGFACYEQALAADIREARAWAHKGVALDSLDRPDEAVDCLRRASELAPEDDEVRLSLGEVLYKLGHFSEALEVFSSVSARRPDSALVWLRIGDCHHALSRDQLALDAYERSLAHDPDSAEGWLKKAVAMFRLGRYPEALAAADRSIERDFRSDFALYIKSAVHFTLGDMGRSLEMAERAVAINPQNRDAARLAQLSRTRHRHGDGAPVITEVFVVLNDGRLLAHASRHPDQTADELLVTGMLTAIRRFIKDSFRLTDVEELGMLEIGHMKILIEQWKSIFSAVVVSGEEPPGLRREMRRMLVGIFDRYHELLRSWDGDVGRLDGIASEASRLLA